MDALLTPEDAATLAAARLILYHLDNSAVKAAMHVLGDADADVNAYDLGRVAESADRAREGLQNVLISAKVFGESEEAGAVL